MADWSQLPRDLITQISTHLETSTDLLRFRSVCATWRSSSVAPKRHRCSCEFPVIPDDGVLNTVSGFRLSKCSVFLVSLPNPCNQTDLICSSWLIKIEEEEDNKKHLFLNPLARHCISSNCLPQSSPWVLDLLKFRVRELGQEFVLQYLNHNAMNDLYMEKVVFLCKDHEEFLLLTIHVSGKLAIFESKEKKWSVIDEMPSPFDDVIMYKGNFYAVDNTGRFVTVRAGLDFKGLDLVADSVYGGDKKYLVESVGDLLLVDTYLSIDTEEEASGIMNPLHLMEEENEYFVQCMHERAVRFKVYRMDWGQRKWVEVKSLGDRLLFIGDNCTFSVSASDLMVPGGKCRGNCVIFGDSFDCLSSGDDDVADTIGVFDLERGCIVPWSSCPEYSSLFWPPPQWLTSTTVEQENHFEGQAK